jgi:N-dimethylarginine dimethylaminohydrolase
MGMLRFADKDLAIAWPRRTPHALVMALRERGYEVAFLPEADDSDMNRAMNFVTLGPRKILLNGGYDVIQDFYESLGINCVTLRARELIKAAGGFGCLAGVLHRDQP